MADSQIPQVTIEDYVADDFSETVKVVKACGLYYQGVDEPEIYRKKIERDPGSIIVAKVDGKIVGSVVIIFDPFLSFGFHLAVLPQYRHFGIGSKLMAEAEQRLKDRGAYGVDLFVDPTNKVAIGLYERRGCINEGQYTCMFKFF